MNNNNHVNNMTLKDWWYKSEHPSSQKRQMFLYIDFAMRFVHSKGYCVKTFDPKEIEILNNSIDQIKFNYLIEMPEEAATKTKLMKEDIYNLALLQVGLYCFSANNFYNMNSNFVKENFDKFVPVLPETDIPYLRGIIERNANVYFTEFELERIKREDNNLQKEIEVLDNKNEIVLKKNLEKKYNDFSNDKINNVIYKQIIKNNEYQKLKNSAFVSIFVYPMIFVILIGILAVLAIVFDLFSI